MKAAAFQELLESVRDTGAYLRGNLKAVVKTDRISPHSVAANSKAVHRAYAKRAQVTLPPLEEYEKDAAKAPVSPLPLPATG